MHLWCAHHTLKFPVCLASLCEAWQTYVGRALTSFAIGKPCSRQYLLLDSFQLAMGKGCAAHLEGADLCAILATIIALTVQVQKLCSHTGADFSSCIFYDLPACVRTVAWPVYIVFTGGRRRWGRRKWSRKFTKSRRSVRTNKFARSALLFRRPVRIFVSD